MTGLCLGDFIYNSLFFIFFCKPVDVVEGISLRNSCFNAKESSGGIRQDCNRSARPSLSWWRTPYWLVYQLFLIMWWGVDLTACILSVHDLSICIHAVLGTRC